MNKESMPHTSQAYDRKHKRDHISSNPRAAKELPSWDDTAGVTNCQTRKGGK